MSPYQLSKDTTLWHGDCIDVMRDMAANFVQLSITDIPYDEVNRDTGGLREFDKGAADKTTFDIEDFIEETVRITSGSMYIWCGFMQISTIDRLFRQQGLTTRLIIWQKTNPAPTNGDKLWLSGIEACVFARKAKATFNDSCRNTVLRFPAGSSKLHPTQKSQELIDELVRISSNDGDMVFDGCLGSGTTGISAVKHHRRFIGCELDEVYFNLAKRRIEEIILLEEAVIF